MVQDEAAFVESHKIDVKLLASNSLSPNDLIEKMALSKSQIENIEKMTRGQSNNGIWIKARMGRITASNFYRVFTKMETVKRNLQKKQSTDCANLVKSLISPASISHLQQIQNGIENESNAIDAAEKKLSESHEHLSIRKCGLFLHAEKPYLGASPDGIITCDCCEHSFLLEVKCPTSNIESLSYLDKNEKLKKKNGYYGQVQGQMLVSGIRTTYFCVYTPDRTILDTVHYDQEFCDALLLNLDKFFNKYLARALLFPQT